MSDMRELRSEVNQLITNEHIRGNLMHGELFSSNHEAIAVIFEEYEEARKEMDSIRDWLDDIWKAVKADDTEAIVEMTESARRLGILAVCEMIQTVAMLEKHLCSIYEWNKEDDNEEKGYQNKLGQSEHRHACHCQGQRKVGQKALRFLQFLNTND